jgi:hypothetical protein
MATLADVRGPRVTDVDGDGIQDVILSMGFFVHVFNSTLFQEDLLASVTDGMNALERQDEITPRLLGPPAAVRASSETTRPPAR